MESSETHQIRELVLQNRFISEILALAPRLKLPQWYLAGECITRTIENVRAGASPIQNIREYLLVYFDPSDLSEKAEEEAEWFAEFVMKDIPVNLRVRNLARSGLHRVEDGIEAGIRSGAEGDWQVVMKHSLGA